ncbi:MAG: hypothetical protein M3P11_09555 [Actinomycetota bacterium]|nr:hypothetical protein [Actinomycetota bacterium]
MHRYLVIANRTLAGGHLVDKLLDLQRAGPCTFYVLVPATPPRDHNWTEAEARMIANERLDGALARFRAAGLEAEGEVGDAHPTEAVGDLLRRGEAFDAIVLSTLPPGISKWLRLDLPHRMEALLELPVIHVTGHAEPQFRSA